MLHSPASIFMSSHITKKEVKDTGLKKIEGFNRHSHVQSHILPSSRFTVSCHQITSQTQDEE